MTLSVNGKSNYFFISSPLIEQNYVNLGYGFDFPKILGDTTLTGYPKISKNLKINWSHELMEKEFLEKENNDKYEQKIQFGNS